MHPPHPYIRTTPKPWLHLLPLLLLLHACATPTPAPKREYPGLSSFTQALQTVHRDYVDPIDSQVLLDHAMQGLLTTSGLTLADVGLPTAALRMNDPGTTADAEPIPFSSLRAFSELYAAIKKRDPALDDMRLFEGAIRGMLTPLDGRSDYLDVEQLNDLKGSSPHTGAIGLELTKEGSAIHIVSALEDTPASRMDFNAGETLTHIDGQPVAGLSLTEVARRLRGPVGSSVALTHTGPRGQSRLTQLQRERIFYTAITSRMASEHIAYVRIKALHNNASRDLDTQLTRLEQTTRLDGIILDLRNNPGGVLNQAVAVADTFIAHGTIVSLRGRTEQANLRYTATPNRPHPQRETLPLVVLVNGGTASGAEILTAALQDNRRAQVIGSGTYGLASVATLFPLPNGGALKLTTSRYLRPAETAIQGQGITPDVCFADNAAPIVRKPPAPCARHARLAQSTAPDRELAYAVERLGRAGAQ